jgi:hypothetical protein
VVESAAAAAGSPAIHTPTPRWTLRAVGDTDREQLATLILNAYRGTVMTRARTTPRRWTRSTTGCRASTGPHWVVMEEEGQAVAVSFVVNVAGCDDIDPVATASSRQREGLGRVV